MLYDYLIVGAGLSGSVIARVLAEAGGKTLLCEKRRHIGGNCFDVIDPAGVRIQPYGAHIFHTDHEEVWRFLSRFTQWRPYQHEVLSYIDGRYIPVPFNFHSLEAAFDGRAPEIQDLLIRKYGSKAKVSILTLLDDNEPLLRELSSYIYDKQFKNYTLKQWGLSPRELSPEVVARVPVYIDYDNRYFTDACQGIPQEGYTAMIQSLLSHPNIEVKLNTPFDSIGRFTNGQITLNGRPFHGKLIYTGPADALFGYQFGPLPYRSLRFEFETLSRAFYQARAVVNYPNDHAFTRIIEFKHMTGQVCPNTTIGREYPEPFDSRNNEPFYPLKTDASERQYRQYAARAEAYDNLVLAGRLAEFRYYDMDDAVGNALQTARKLLQ
jgi:UDP-galactopyranose mutase